MRILVAEALALQSTYHRTKTIPGQICFGRDLILLINHVADWRYMCQRKQTQIDKYFTCKSTTIIDHDYRVGDKILIKNKSSYRYETLFRGLYEIFQTWANGTITLRMVAVKHRINILNIKPYNDTDV